MYVAGEDFQSHDLWYEWGCWQGQMSDLLAQTHQLESTCDGLDHSKLVIS